MHILFFFPKLFLIFATDYRSLRWHHTLPQKYRKQFEKLEINIDEPGNVVWRQTKEHQKKSHILTKKWDDYFNHTKNPTKEDILRTKDKFELELFNTPKQP